MQVVDGFKTCSRCKEAKSVSEFGKGGNVDGLNSQCKPCDRARQRERTTKRNLRDNLVPEGVISKLCAKCGQEKSLSQFNKNASGTYGVTNFCIPCIKEFNAARYQEKKEEIRSHCKEYREANPEKVKEATRRWREENFEKWKEGTRKNCEEHSLEYQARARKWKEKNPEKYRAIVQKRNYFRRSVEESAEADKGISPQALHAIYKGICQLCLEECSLEEATVDHKLPITRKGQHIWNNVHLACQSCNSRKGALTVEEFIQKLIRQGNHSLAHKLGEVHESVGVPTDPETDHLGKDDVGDDVNSTVVMLTEQDIHPVLGINLGLLRQSTTEVR